MDTASHSDRARFSALWTSGKTIREIADEMEMSKNSVPGTAARLGLAGRGSPILVGSGEAAKRAYAPRPAHTAPNVNRKLASRVPPKKRGRVDMDQIRLEQSRNLPLADLQSGDCRFPTSPGRPHLFCGAKATHGSYCAGHHQVTHGVGTPSERAAARLLDRHKEADLTRIAA